MKTFPKQGNVETGQWCSYGVSQNEENMNDGGEGYKCLCRIEMGKFEQVQDSIVEFRRIKRTEKIQGAWSTCRKKG